MEANGHGKGSNADARPIAVLAKMGCESYDGACMESIRACSLEDMMDALALGPKMAAAWRCIAERVIARPGIVGGAVMLMDDFFPLNDKDHREGVDAIVALVKPAAMAAGGGPLGVSTTAERRAGREAAITLAFDVVIKQDGREAARQASEAMASAFEGALAAHGFPCLALAPEGEGRDWDAIQGDALDWALAMDQAKQLRLAARKPAKAKATLAPRSL